jgi:hypothetical protein
MSGPSPRGASLLRARPAKRLDRAGPHAASMTVDAYHAFLRRDSETWAKVVRAGTIRVDSD